MCKTAPVMNRIRCYECETKHQSSATMSQTRKFFKDAEIDLGELKRYLVMTPPFFPNQAKLHRKLIDALGTLQKKRTKPLRTAKKAMPGWLNTGSKPNPEL